MTEYFAICINCFVIYELRWLEIWVLTMCEIWLKILDQKLIWYREVIWSFDVWSVSWGLNQLQNKSHFDEFWQIPRNLADDQEISVNSLKFTWFFFHYVKSFSQQCWYIFMKLSLWLWTVLLSITWSYNVWFILYSTFLGSLLNVQNFISYVVY